MFRDAWQVYRLLFRRSVLTAAIVYGAIALLNAGKDVASSGAVTVPLGIVAFVAEFAGPVRVQGALVEIVRNVHEGLRPKRIESLYRDARSRFWSLLAASIVYGLGVVFGLVLLIVPGIIAAARWCLMAPLIMLEGFGAGAARERSAGLVGGRTGAVAAIVVGTFVVLSSPALILAFAIGPASVSYQLASFAWNALTAPFAAHVLTVIYYRLTDGDRPVIHPDVAQWPSVWS